MSDESKEDNVDFQKQTLRNHKMVWATGSNVSRYDVDEKRKNSETEFIDKIARPSLVGFRQELVSGLEYH